MNEADCHFCEKQHTHKCPNSYYCYNKKDKPYFKPKKIYKSKFICGDKIYYNINHFNKFQKLLARVIWKIRIEDVGE